MSRLRISAILVLAGTIACLVLPTVGNSEAIDTTRVSQTEKIKKSTGEIISDIPGRDSEASFATR